MPPETAPALNKKIKSEVDFHLQRGNDQAAADVINQARATSPLEDEELLHKEWVLNNPDLARYWAEKGGAEHPEPTKEELVNAAHRTFAIQRGETPPPVIERPPLGTEKEWGNTPREEAQLLQGNYLKAAKSMQQQIEEPTAAETVRAKTQAWAEAQSWARAARMAEEETPAATPAEIAEQKAAAQVPAADEDLVAALQKSVEQVKAKKAAAVPAKAPKAAGLQPYQMTPENAWDWVRNGKEVAEMTPEEIKAAQQRANSLFGEVNKRLDSEKTAKELTGGLDQPHVTGFIDALNPQGVLHAQERAAGRLPWQQTAADYAERGSAFERRPAPEAPKLPDFQKLEANGDVKKVGNAWQGVTDEGKAAVRQANADVADYQQQTRAWMATERDRLKFKELLFERHPGEVEDALRLGEDVPPEVLRDYPELAAKYNKPTKEAPSTAPEKLKKSKAKRKAAAVGAE